MKIGQDVLDENDDGQINHVHHVNPAVASVSVTRWRDPICRMRLQLIPCPRIECHRWSMRIGVSTELIPEVRRRW